MARYDFECERCDLKHTIVISVIAYKELKDSNNNPICKKCGKSDKMNRIFSPTSSKIWRGKEELMSTIKEDARKIVNKIKSGDQTAIREIYGEDK
jgi:hypothetical protein